MGRKNVASIWAALAMGIGIGLSESANVQDNLVRSVSEPPTLLKRALGDAVDDSSLRSFQYQEILVLALVGNVLAGLCMTCISVCICSARQARINPSDRPLTPNQTSVWFLLSFFMGIVGWLPVQVRMHLAINRARVESPCSDRIKSNYLPSFKIDSEYSPDSAKLKTFASFDFPAEEEQVNGSRVKPKSPENSSGRRKTAPPLTLTQLTLAEELEVARYLSCNNQPESNSSLVTF